MANYSFFMNVTSWMKYPHGAVFTHPDVKNSVKLDERIRYHATHCDTALTIREKLFEAINSDGDVSSIVSPSDIHEAQRFMIALGKIQDPDKRTDYMLMLIEWALHKSVQYYEYILLLLDKNFTDCAKNERVARHIADLKRNLEYRASREKVITPAGR